MTLHLPAQMVECFAGHDDVVTCVAISPDCKLLVSVLRNCRLHPDGWTIPRRPPPPLMLTFFFPLKLPPVAAIRYTQATGATDEKIRVWQLRRGNAKSATVDADGDGSSAVTENGYAVPLLVLSGHPGRSLAVAWSPSGDFLLSGGGDRTAKVWECHYDPPLPLHRLPPPAIPPRHRGPRPRSRMVGKLVRRLAGHKGWVSECAGRAGRACERASGRVRFLFLFPSRPSPVDGTAFFCCPRHRLPATLLLLTSVGHIQCTATR